jgi:hypothetical protein
LFSSYFAMESYQALLAFIVLVSLIIGYARNLSLLTLFFFMCFMFFMVILVFVLVCPGWGSVKIEPMRYFAIPAV